MYCADCRLFTYEERCPLCGTKKLREVKPDDPCFLVHKEEIWARMLEEVLKDKGIAYDTEAYMGAAMALKVGGHNEAFDIYVLYADLEQARATVEELFGGTENDEIDSEKTREKTKTTF